jgi:hypothetical protein
MTDLRKQKLEEIMFDAGRMGARRRVMGWLVRGVALAAVVGGALSLRAVAAPVPQSGPALTTVSDTVYRADGTPAQGTLVITWPAFLLANGTPIAAGVNNVTLGTAGQLTTTLVPNVGVTPAGMYYTVVYQLNDGTTRTEYWLVPTTSPANLATVRTTPGSGTAAQPVSMQYVNTALAGKANDNAVVHLATAETITGTKSFTAVPNTPTPANSGDVANKGYVDNAVSNVGAGNFVPVAGGAMTGPLTLSGSPVAALQAAPKQYVDTGLATKADLVSGRVPTSELGTGTTSPGVCLYGNQTWGACGNVSTTPSATQAIAEPAGAVFTANRIGQKRMADQFNWKQSPTSPVALTPGAVTVALSPCPQGFLNTVNGSNSNHWIYVDSATGDAQQPGEPVLITGENCAAGSASGTITFSVAYAHAAGYALESGTGGIKEAMVDANQVRYDTVRGNNTWVELTPNQVTTMKAPLYWQTSMGRLSGSSLIECTVNMSCINVGDTNSLGWASGNTGTYFNNVMDGFWLRPSSSMVFWDVTPSTPTTITAGSTSVTLQIPTCPAGFWPKIPNQILWLNGTSGGLVTTVYEAAAPGPGEFAQVTGGTCTPGATNGTIIIVPATPGLSAFAAHGTGYTLSNGATSYIEDNSENTVISNIMTNGWAGNVGYGFVVQNDNNQAEAVTNLTMMGGTRCDNDFCGATLFGPGPNTINAGITTFSGGTNQACAVWYDGNDLSIGPTVCQGFQNYAIFMSTKRGGSLQHAVLHTVHRERGGLSNSLGVGLGAADMIVQGYSVTADGNGDGVNEFPGFAVAGTPGGQLQAYYLSIMDVTDGIKTVPIPLGTANVANPNANNVTVRWVAADALSGKTINFELYRVALLAGAPGIVPNPNVCDGVNGDLTCLVATNISPATVCDIHGACTFTDNVQTPGAVTPYTGIDGAGSGYFPNNSFSPGGIVLNNSATYQGEPACLVVMGGWLNNFASIFDNEIAPAGCVPSGGSFNLALTSFSNNGGGYTQWGLLLPDRNKTADGGNWTNLKGRINLIGGGTYPRDAFTWVDSNPAKTLASKLEYGSGVVGSVYGSVNRPQWDVGDVATGVENAGTGLYNRVPGSGVFDWYVGALPNSPGGTSNNWTEELSASGHTINVPVTVNGNLTVTGVCTGCGGGGSGSGTVNSGTASQVAVYPGNGAAVSGDGALSDSGTTLNYAGSGGISAAAGTFSGNVTVNGQLMVAGPWMVDSPVPGSAMGAAPSGTSSLGISNDGNFYISANAGTPQKVATTGTSSYFSNLFQEDPNDLGEYNGTTAQNLHVYSSYTNSSTWQRTSVGFDTTDSYAVVRSESSTSGGAPGLGFWINNGLKWVIDASSNLKPWADEAYNIGTFSASTGLGLRPGTVYVAGSTSSNSGFELGRFADESYELCNDTTNGTVLNGLAVLTTAGCAVKPSSATTSGVIGVVIAPLVPGTSGFVTLVRTGSAYCSFDAAATVVGDYVVASPTQNPAASGFYPLCHDAGSTQPTGVQVLGRVLQATSGGTTAQIFFDMPGSNVSSSGSGAVSSVFGRTGAVVAGSGDYQVSQVTGAASLASPTFTGTVTEPDGTTNTSSGYTFGHALTLPSGSVATTQAAGDNSTKVATDAFAHAVVPPDSGSTVWIPVPHASSSGTVFSATANKAAFFGVMLGFQKTTSQVSYYVATADTSSATYDLGIYSGTSAGTCTLQAHTGAIAGSTAMTAGAHTVSWTGGSVTLPPGRYYLALTASATSSTAVLYGDSAGVTFAGGTGTSNVGNVSIASGGTLPATATCPTDSVVVAGLIPAWLVD